MVFNNLNFDLIKKGPSPLDSASLHSLLINPSLSDSLPTVPWKARQLYDLLQRSDVLPLSLHPYASLRWPINLPRYFCVDFGLDHSIHSRCQFRQVFLLQDSSNVSKEEEQGQFIGYQNLAKWRNQITNNFWTSQFSWKRASK